MAPDTCKHHEHIASLVVETKSKVDLVIFMWVIGIMITVMTLAFGWTAKSQSEVLEGITNIKVKQEVIKTEINQIKETVDKINDR